MALSDFVAFDLVSILLDSDRKSHHLEKRKKEEAGWMFCGPVRTTSTGQVCWPKMTKKIVSFSLIFQMLQQRRKHTFKEWSQILQGKKGKSTTEARRKALILKSHLSKFTHRISHTNQLVNCILPGKDSG